MIKYHRHVILSPIVVSLLHFIHILILILMYVCSSLNIKYFNHDSDYVHDETLPNFDIKDIIKLHALLSKAHHLIVNNPEYSSLALLIHSGALILSITDPVSQRHSLTVTVASHHNLTIPFKSLMITRHPNYYCCSFHGTYLCKFINSIQFNPNHPQLINYWTIFRYLPSSPAATG